MRKFIFYILMLSPLFVFSQQKEDIKEEKKVNYAFVPLLMYNTSLGWQFGIMSSAYFKLSETDTISPASSVGFFGSYYTSESYVTVLHSKMHLKEDNYRVKTAVGYGNINFQNFIDYSYFPDWIQPILPEGDGFFMDYTTQFFFAYAEGMKRVWNNLFVGAHLMYNKNRTQFFYDDYTVKTEENSLLGIGIAAELDNRDNVFYPHSGQNVRVGTMSFLEALGSSTEYHRIKFQYNKYFKLNPNTVILARAYGVSSFGDVPFSGENVVGNDDLRGYSNGKFRAKQVYDLQTELRWNFYKKWGMVAFGGVAVATDDFSGTNYSGLLPGVGVGLRFKAVPSKNINIGIDVAKGVDDWGVYFRIGEAFTR